MSRNPNPSSIGQAERAEVIALALKVGAAETARRTGHKSTTIRSWVKRAHDAVELADRMAALDRVIPEPEQPAHVEHVLEVEPIAEVEQPAPSAVEQSRPTTSAPAPFTPDPRPWQAQRADVVRRLASVVHRATEAAERAIEAGNARKAKDFMLTAAIGVDKAQLLTGAATARTESETRTLQLRIDATPEEARAEVERLRGQLGIAPRAAIETTTTTEDDR